MMAEVTGLGSRVGSRPRIYVVVETVDGEVIDLLKAFTDQKQAYDYSAKQRERSKKFNFNRGYHVEYVPMEVK
jgi:hypothetical protein